MDHENGALTLVSVVAVLFALYTAVQVSQQRALLNRMANSIQLEQDVELLPGTPASVASLVVPDGYFVYQVGLRLLNSVTFSSETTLSISAATRQDLLDAEPDSKALTNLAIFAGPSTQGSALPVDAYCVVSAMSTAVIPRGKLLVRVAAGAPPTTSARVRVYVMLVQIGLR